MTEIISVSEWKKKQKSFCGIIFFGSVWASGVCEQVCLRRTVIKITLSRQVESRPTTLWHIQIEYKTVANVFYKCAQVTSRHQDFECTFYACRDEASGEKKKKTKKTKLSQRIWYSSFIYSISMENNKFKYENFFTRSLTRTQLTWMHIAWWLRKNTTLRCLSFAVPCSSS